MVRSGLVGTRPDFSNCENISVAVPVIPRTCAFAGMTTIYFRTYTTTYPFITTGWQFDGSNDIPVEFYGYSKNKLPVAIRAQFISLSHGYTNVSLGDNSGATALFGGYYDGEKIYGWTVQDGSGFSNPLYGYSYGFSLDTDLINSAFQVGVKNLIPGNNNTGAPKPFFGINFPAANDHIYSSGESNLTPWNFLLYKDGTEFVTAAPAPDMGLSSFLSANAGMPGPDNLSYMSVGSGPTPTNRTLLIETDYVTFARQVQVTWDDATIDGEIIPTQNIGAFSKYGWLKIIKDTITFQGQTLNGCLVITAPDCSTYQIAKLIPIDATAMNWRTGFGNITTRLDRDGALWMKNVNSDTTLFVSAGSVIKQLPIFPPLPIPDHGDTDPTLLNMRGK